MIACDAGLDEIKEGKYRKRSGLSIIYIYILLFIFLFNYLYLHRQEARQQAPIVSACIHRSI